MRFVLALILLLVAAPPVHAQDMLATRDGDSVRITQKPCEVGVLRHIPEGSRGFFRKALVQLQGQEYIACWAVRVDGMVLVVYSDGDQGLIPIAQFAVVPDA